MMPRTIRSLVVAAAIAVSGTFAATLGPPAPAQAQTDTMESPTIAVIDMQKIRRESEAVKSIEQQIQEQKSAYQKELSEKEKEIREENQSLSKQRTLLAKDAFEKKRQNLRKKLGNFRRDIQTRRKALDQNYSEAMRRVQKKLIEVVRQVASERNLDVVLNKGTVVLVRPDMEITEIALQRLNDQLTSVDVPNIQE
jgi:Skp family chaperone for outer membrane proteins